MLSDLTTGLTMPKVIAGDSVLTTDGLNIANGAAGSPVSLTKDGLNNSNNKVHGVKAVAKLREEDPELAQDYEKLLILIQN